MVSGADPLGLIGIHRRIAPILTTVAAFVLRSAGARLDGYEFERLFAAAIGGVGAKALILRIDHARVRMIEYRDGDIGVLVQRGMRPDEAPAHCAEGAPGHRRPD
jgi:hypothetical protein